MVSWVSRAGMVGLFVITTNIRKWIAQDPRLCADLSCILWWISCIAFYSLDEGVFYYISDIRTIQYVVCVAVENMII